MDERAITGYVEFSDGVRLPVCWNGAGGRGVVRFVVEGEEFAPGARAAELESLARDMWRSLATVSETWAEDEYADRMAELGIETGGEES